MSYIFSPNSSILNSNGYPITTTSRLPVDIGNTSISISGNVNVNFPDVVSVNSTPSNPVHVHLTEIGNNVILDNYVPISGNVNVTTIPNTNVLVINTANVYSLGGYINVSNFPVSQNVVVTSIPNTNVNVLNTANTYSMGGTINVNNFPASFQVIQNTSPWIISGNVNVVTTPLTPVDIVPAAAATTAFDEPLSVGITPVIQGDSVYGLDPDFWNTTKLNGGGITLANSTWQVYSSTTTGGYARLATSKYMTYQPGQGAMFRWTAAFTANGTTKDAAGVDNIVQNSGPIDREDGYSIGYSGASTNNSVRKIGFLHRLGGKIETRNFTVTVAPTGTQTANITLNGVSYSASLTAASNTQYTAHQIAKSLRNNANAGQLWDVDACGNTVTLMYYTPGARSGTYSFTSSGTGTLANGTFTTITTGASPSDTWTYVDQWDNKSVSFDPTKLNVYGLDMRWLGSGIVRLFMEDPATGKMTLMHTQKWGSSNTIPHVIKPSLRLVYRSGTTSGAIPSQNVVVTGASVYGAIQGSIIQTGSSQSYYNLDTTTRAKDIIWHLLSIQNPILRNNTVNKTSLIIQDISVATKSVDPSILFLVKNSTTTSDLLLFQALPNASAFNFAQYSTTAVTADLSTDQLAMVQTLGVNGSAQFNLKDFNVTLAPGETISVFMSSTSSFNGTTCGITWRVD